MLYFPDTAEKWSMDTDTPELELGHRQDTDMADISKKSRLELEDWLSKKLQNQAHTRLY